MTTFRLLLALLLASLPAAATAQHAGDLATRADKAALRHVEDQGLIGLSCALAVGNSIAWSSAYGWQDREAGIRTSAATMYRWASISKPVTAVVAMQLAREGRLDLDADVRTLVPEFPEKPHAITPRQLLCHQGGIVHYANGPVIRTRREYDAEHPFASVILALDTFKESPLVCEPGTRYSYTTHGYILLGAACERAGGEPYWSLVRTRVAEPLAMESFQPDYQWLDIPNRAAGYRRQGGEVVRSTDTDVSWKLPGGGFISTVADLARFGLGLCGEDLLDQSLKDRMWTRQTTADGEETPYGLGFRIDTLDGTLMVSHSGSQEKARTHLIVLPQQRIVVAVMSNCEWADPGRLARELIQTAADTP